MPLTAILMRLGVTGQNRARIRRHRSEETATNKWSSLQGANIIILKEEQKLKLLSIEQLYKSLPFELSSENCFLKVPLQPIYLLDKNGKWVRLKRIVKYYTTHCRLYLVRTETGQQVILNEDQCIMTLQGKQLARLLSRDTKLFLVSEIKIPSTQKELNLINLFVNSAISGSKYNIFTERKISLLELQRQFYNQEEKAIKVNDCFISAYGRRYRRSAVLTLTSSLGWLLGLFICKGFSQSDHLELYCPAELYNQAVNCLKNLGIGYSSRRRQALINILDPFIKDLFVGIWQVGPRNRSLPAEIISYNQDFLKGTIAGIIDSSAHLLNDRVCIKSSSITLINQLNILLQMLGFTTQLKQEKVIRTTETTVQVLRNWTLSFYKEENITLPSAKYNSLHSTNFSSFKKSFTRISDIQFLSISNQVIYEIETESRTYLANNIWLATKAEQAAENIKVIS
jgi:hypothetical protein